jgi:DNA-binding GntR family transcriptional regulator
VIESVHRPALWEAVLQGMRDAIQSGELPAGEKLVESDLAARFGTSRGPIREAVRELIREGLVVEYPRRGNIVATLTAQDLEEIYGIREMLDIGAAERFVEWGDDRVLRPLERHLDALEQSHEYLKSRVHDLAFHRALVASMGNARMAAINEQMLTQTANLLHTAVAADPTLQSHVRPSSHRDILAALTRRDVEAARLAIGAHYRYAAELLRPALEYRLRDVDYGDAFFARGPTRA